MTKGLWQPTVAIGNIGPQGVSATDPVESKIESCGDKILLSPLHFNWNRRSSNSENFEPVSKIKDIDMR